MLDDLTQSELVGLTGATTARKQVVKLLSLGMPFRVAGGVVYVARAVAEHWPQFQQRQQSARPRLDLVR